MSHVGEISYRSPQTPPPLEPPPLPGKHDWVWAPATFGALTLALFADILFSTTRAAAHVNADLSMQFIAWREYGFGQLRQGNIPLWNPHIFGGASYFAGFQSALIYPPNWLHLILPMAMAINWISALHIFLAGYFTYFWVRGRGVGIGGAILAGIMFMFCGPYFLHLYAGHLPHIAVMVWTPLMLLTIDKLGQTGNWRWVLLGIAAITMEILAGHPQYVYYTGMALGIYLLIQLNVFWLFRYVPWMRGSSLLNSFPGSVPRHWLTMVVGFGVMYIGAVLLAAMQFLPGLAATSEQVRSGGLPYSVASTFSLPPQNVITALAPTFFGFLPPAGEKVADGAYWGTDYLWEVSIFISITGLVLAVMGAATRFKKPNVWIALAMLAVTAILALGRYTPLYYPMYKLLPMYSSFRGTVKFAYLASLFVAYLAGEGFGSVLDRRKIPWFGIYPVAIVALLVALFACMVWSSAASGEHSAWVHFVRDMSERGIANQEQWFKLKPDEELWTMLTPDTARNIAKAGIHAAQMTLLAAGTLALVAALLWACRLDRRAPYLLILLAAVELFTFARTNRPTMDPAGARTMPGEAFQNALATLPPGQRFLTDMDLSHRADLGMILGKDNVSGYDPGIQKRYAELYYAAQGFNPADASQYLPVNLNHLTIPIYRLLRCNTILDPHRGLIHLVKPGSKDPIDVLPEATVISDWVKMQNRGSIDRDAILRYMISPAFDPTVTVVLEEAPRITTTPAAAAPGKVSILGKTTDTLEIQADMDRPGILLITDSYSNGWRVKPIQAGQADYEVMPADYAMMAIPLEKGSHHFVLEYAPPAFTIGMWITIVSLLIFTGALVFAYRTRRVCVVQPPPAVSAL
jgi:hypothetical protein